MKTVAIVAERQSSKTIDRQRVQMLRTDARQHSASIRLNRALNEYQAARSAYDEAVGDYIRSLEERGGQA